MAELRRKSSTSIRRQSKASHAPSNYDVKCVVLGDGNVGKSAMLLTYLTGSWQEEISAGPMDSLSEYDHLTKHPVNLKHDNTQIHMTLVDTYGQDEYDRLRERIAAYADVYVVCFDVSRPATFERIQHYWLPEFRRYSAPDTPFLVIGLKTDIRSAAMAKGEGYDASEFVTFFDGQKASQQMGAAHYMECRAINDVGGVKRAIEKVGQIAVMNMLPDDAKRSSCVVS